MQDRMNTSSLFRFPSWFHALLVITLLLCGQHLWALDASLADGLKAAKKGDHNAAIELFTEVLRRDPTHVDALYNRGVSYQATLQRAKAIEDFTSVIEHDPSSISAYTNRGNIRFVQGDYDSAISDFSEAITLNPKSWTGYKNRGGAYLLKRDYQRAIADLDLAVQLNPGDFGALKNRGNAYHCLGQFSKAVADYNVVLLLNPIDAVALCNRGDAYRSLREYAKAIADYSEAIEVNAAFSLPHNSLATVLATCPLASFRDGAKAVEHAQKACELSKWKTPAELETLAAAHAEAGDFAQAARREKEYLDTSGLSESDSARAKDRLALYQSGKPYHAAK